MVEFINSGIIIRSKCSIENDFVYNTIINRVGSELGLVVRYFLLSLETENAEIDVAFFFYVGKEYLFEYNLKFESASIL